MLMAPRPVPLHHRATQAQMTKGFHLSPDECWGSGQTLNGFFGDFRSVGALRQKVLHLGIGLGHRR
jgi:hypothetical protein